ncbi:hypothetical protein GIB67_022973 [Kingdonia uniflora]|uniref:Uncharacterized protein n=1 Tax=Kingdonia uniflora TaxID=39325 RepID=A0A7J7P369_9MAGN|nr:hypothetical protein GIB67_022973 [Kingdonia uniflora]
MTLTISIRDLAFIISPPCTIIAYKHGSSFNRVKTYKVERKKSLLSWVLCSRWMCFKSIYQGWIIDIVITNLIEWV